MDLMLSLVERAALLDSPLLQGAESTLIDEILASPNTSLLSFQSGDTVYTPGQFQRSLGVVLSGSLQVRRATLFVSALTAGDLFGAAALYSDAPNYTATLTGASEGRILFLSYPLVDSLMATSPLLRENYLRYLTGRIRFLNGRLHSLAAGDGETKLARHLLSSPAPLTCSAVELASLLGVGRATLYRAFQSLEESGAILRSGRTITVLDSDLLQHYT